MPIFNGTLPEIKNLNEVEAFIRKKESGIIFKLINNKFYMFILICILSMFTKTFTLCLFFGVLLGIIYGLNRDSCSLSSSDFPSQPKIITNAIFGGLLFIFYFLTVDRNKPDFSFLLLLGFILITVAIVYFFKLKNNESLYNEIKEIRDDIFFSKIRFYFFFNGKSVNYTGEFSCIDGLDGKEETYDYNLRFLEKRKQELESVALSSDEDNEIEDIMKTNYSFKKQSSDWNEYIRTQKVFLKKYKPTENNIK